MSSLDEAVFLLEKTVDRFLGYAKNLKAEKDFLIQELDRKEQLLHYYSRYKALTLKKLQSIKQVLTEEIHIDLDASQLRKKESGNISILMLDDEIQE